MGRTREWLVVALVALVVVALAWPAAGKKGEGAAAKVSEDDDDFMDIEDFSWQIADDAEEVCLQYCKEKRKRPFLCNVFSQLVGMVADHTLGSVNRFLNFRKEAILKKYYDPIFKLELTTKLRDHKKLLATMGRGRRTPAYDVFMICGRGRL